MNLHDRDNFMMGKKEGINEKAIETAKNFLQMGIPIEQIAQGQVFQSKKYKHWKNTPLPTRTQEVSKIYNV